MTARRLPRTADYKREKDSTATLIEGSIPAYNERLLMDMIQECMSVVDGAEKLGLVDPKPSGDAESPFLKPWTIRNLHHERAYYTMKFSNPVIYHIPPLLGHLKQRLRMFRTSVAEYVPCYMMNLNRVVLAKFNPPYYDNIGDGILGQFVLQGGMRMRLSSANVFMPGAAQHRSLRCGPDTVKAYFAHAWWHFPLAQGMRDASCLHNLVYHYPSRVRQVVRLRKTLVRVLKIGRRDSRAILNNEKAVACAHVLASLLVDNGRTLASEKRWILMRDGMSSLVKEDHILNAILVEPDITQPKFCVMMGHIGSPMQFADGSILSTAVSIANWSAMRDAGPESSLTEVGSIEEVAERVEKTIGNNGGPEGVFELPWKFTHGDVKRVIDGFSPLYVRAGGTVYHTPPSVASFVLAKQPSLLDNQSAVGVIARMFDTVEPSAKKWDVNAIGSLIVKENKPSSASFSDALLAHVPRLAGESALSRMIYCQLLCRHRFKSKEE